ncbi:hypothetical protein Q8F55_004706 [Vanrija albida]|uniref:AB hydrolase-1 domain-containing protein n=1 Tax=Vanrija albida TaxID=181172 RepID=A0ABR3Q852_9TREE
MVDFASFQRQAVSVQSPVVGTVDIATRSAGSGPGLLLLHGHPQTSHIWRFVAPRLAEHFTVVCADLRGYGASSKPRGSDTHVEYSKREMANDMIQVMKHYGFDRFDVLSHDRGARVAHRLGVDHPASVRRLVVLDIAPTLYMYEHTDMAFALAYWHWFFLPQPAPGPETVMMADPERFWDMLSGRSHFGIQWTAEDDKEYKTPYFTPEGTHAACEDYRAAATIDLEHDRASREAGDRLKLEALLVLWGARGVINRYDDPVGIWREQCDAGVEVSGGPTSSGHYIAEEVPEELWTRLDKFFSL